jgi:hypothetical protein
MVGGMKVEVIDFRRGCCREAETEKEEVAQVWL